MRKLAIIATHPVQYYAPWFRFLANNSGLITKVFYLHDAHVASSVDPGFKVAFEWDVPLLDGYDHEFIQKGESRGRFDAWRASDALLSAVKTYNPQIVFLTGYNNPVYYRFIFCWNRDRAPLIFRGDSHRLFVRWGPDEILRRRFIALIFRKFSAILYVGHANYDYFRYHDVPEERLFFSPHAVDNERFLAQAVKAGEEAQACKNGLGIQPDHKVVLFAGKFEQKKRPVDLLEAFRIAGLQKVDLLFVGSGCLESELRRRSREVDNVYFAPFQNQSLMPRTYAAADLFVLPSYGKWETWGLSINEAMCMAKPVIVSSHVGCAQDLVVPGENGLIFPAGDVEALAACLKKALKDEGQLVAWGRAGQERIKGFSYREATAGLCKACEIVQSRR
jgi:glycosyltransferase involved in cell wall biosynthesis